MRLDEDPGCSSIDYIGTVVRVLGPVVIAVCCFANTIVSVSAIEKSIEIVEAAEAKLSGPRQDACTAFLRERYAKIEQPIIEIAVPRHSDGSYGLPQVVKGDFIRWMTDRTKHCQKERQKIEEAVGMRFRGKLLELVVEDIYVVQIYEFGDKPLREFLIYYEGHTVGTTNQFAWWSILKEGYCSPSSFIGSPLDRQFVIKIEEVPYIAKVDETYASMNDRSLWTTDAIENAAISCKIDNVVIKINNE